MLMACVALAIAAIRHPNPYLAKTTELLSFAALAIAGIIAYDRKCTPAAGFLALGLLSLPFADEAASHFGFSALAGLNIPTGSDEYYHVRKVFVAYFTISWSCIGYVIGSLIGRRSTGTQTEGDPSSKNDAV